MNSNDFNKVSDACNSMIFSKDKIELKGKNYIMQCVIIIFLTCNTNDIKKYQDKTKLTLLFITHYFRI